MAKYDDTYDKKRHIVVNWLVAETPIPTDSNREMQNIADEFMDAIFDKEKIVLAYLIRNLWIRYTSTELTLEEAKTLANKLLNEYETNLGESMRINDAERILNENGYMLVETTITKENAADYLQMAEKGMMDWEDLAKMAINSILGTKREINQDTVDEINREREFEFYDEIR
jgi:hypothetical protein